jgi:hypothetical protein
VTDLFAALLAIVSNLTPAVTPAGEIPETVAEREERYETIVAADLEAARETSGLWGLRSRAAGVVAVQYSETLLNRYVHAGIPHPDPDKHQDHGRAICLSSLHRTAWWTLEYWKSFAGTSFAASRRCALATIRVLKSAAYLCARGKTGEEAMAWTLEQYATGAKDCRPPCDESRKRAALWAGIAAQLGRAK